MIELVGLPLATLASVLRSRQRLLLENLLLRASRSRSPLRSSRSSLGLRRLLSRRGRLPATPRDWRLHDAVTSLASGGVMLLAIGQGLMLGPAAPLRTSSAPVLLVLAMGLAAVLIFVAALVAFLRVEYRPRPGTGHRH